MEHREQQLQRIQEMEVAMRRYNQTLQQVQQAVKDLTQAQKTYSQLRDYYATPLYMEDFDYSNQSDFPVNQPAGVLSEDGLYDLFDEHRQLALDLLDTASVMLRNY